MTPSEQLALWIEIGARSADPASDVFLLALIGKLGEPAARETFNVFGPPCHFVHRMAHLLAIPVYMAHGVHDLAYAKAAPAEICERLRSGSLDDYRRSAA